MTETPLAAEDRARLARLADAILPRTASMPSASDVGVQAELIDRVLRTAPALAPRITAALARVDDDPSVLLEQLRGRDPSLFRDVFVAICAAYYLAPEVKDRLGYRGQEAKTIDVHELPSYLEDGTLDRVIARGPRRRDPDAPR